MSGAETFQKFQEALGRVVRGEIEDMRVDPQMGLLAQFPPDPCVGSVQSPHC